MPVSLVSTRWFQGAGDQGRRRRNHDSHTQKRSSKLRSKGISMEPMTLYPTLSTECCENVFSLREPRFSEGRCFLGVTRRKSRALGLSSGPSVTRHYSYLSRGSHS